MSIWVRLRERKKSKDQATTDSTTLNHKTAHPYCIDDPLVSCTVWRKEKDPIPHWPCRRKLGTGYFDKRVSKITQVHISRGRGIGFLLRQLRVIEMEVDERGMERGREEVLKMHIYFNTSIRYNKLTQN